MRYFRARFERSNFYFTPPLEQSVDVVFALKEGLVNSDWVTIGAWNALYENFPSWCGAGDVEMDRPLGTGWSSATLDFDSVRELVKVYQTFAHAHDDVYRFQVVDNDLKM